ncbi:pentapeptide repeat-containing protein [Anabaena azotica]|uniref:pentapeptide repeat-containing protein n=1 Tax=Anabaena azotica TaxID=197653 RepID=UPI0039A559BE
MSKNQEESKLQIKNLPTIAKNSDLEELPEVKQLRQKFFVISEISDPLTRECQFALLQKQAEKTGLSAETYRRLFETYLQNKEHISQYPKKWWSLIEWCNWFFNIPKKTKLGLIKKIILTALEKGFLLTLAISLFKYFQEAPKRQKQAHYQAWQIINSANEQGATSSRIEALQDLNEDGVSLRKLRANGADLNGINLDNALLIHVYFQKADLNCIEIRNNQKCTSIRNADLSWGHLQEANFYKADLRKSTFYEAEMQGTRLILANLQDANLENAKLEKASLFKADLQRAKLQGANFQGADVEDVNFRDAMICGLEYANLANIICANFIGAKNLTPEQVKSAKKWENACYDQELRKQLGLPPENPNQCSAK